MEISKHNIDITQKRYVRRASCRLPLSLPPPPVFRPVLMYVEAYRTRFLVVLRGRWDCGVFVLPFVLAF